MAFSVSPPQESTTNQGNRHLARGGMDLHPVNETQLREDSKLMEAPSVAGFRAILPLVYTPKLGQSHSAKAWSMPRLLTMDG